MRAQRLRVHRSSASAVRHRYARHHGDGWRRRSATRARRSTHSDRRNLRRGRRRGVRGRSRRAADALAARLHRRSNPRASRPGGATPITSRRRSFSAACRRATASPPRCSCRSGWNGVDDVFSGDGQLLPRQRAERRDPALLVEELGERYEIAQHRHQEMDASARRFRRRSTRSRRSRASSPSRPIR